MKSNSSSFSATKIILLIVSILLIIYFLFAILPGTLFPNGLETEIVEKTSYSDNIELNGIALRNEILLYADGTIGAVSYNIDNGERVAKGASVAEYVTDASTEENYVKLATLNRKIDMVQESLSKSAISDTAALENLVNSKINNYLDTLNAGNFSKNEADAVQVSLNKKAVMLTGGDIYRTELENLQAEKETLLSSIGNEKSVIATQAGYFLSSFDGYETIVADEYNKMTVSDFNSLLTMQPALKSENYIGKLNNNSIWYFAADVSEDVAKQYKAGDSVTLVFNVASTLNDTIKASVYSISEVENGKAIIVYKCTYFTEKEFSMRFEKCKMLLKTYEGLKVSNEALRISDEQTGVYVLVAKRVVFKPVSVLFSTELYSIVEPVSSVSSRTLTNYDEVVLGGKDLFDGKVVGVG